MKTLNDYMKMSYRMEIVEDQDEGGFVVSYPDLPGCITCGWSIFLPFATTISIWRRARRSSSGFFAVTMKSAHFPGSIVPVSAPIPAISAARAVTDAYFSRISRICCIIFLIS